MNFSNYKVFFRSPLFKKILCGLGVLIVALTIFQAGIFVGYRKASFSYRIGDNYHNMFGVAPRRGMMGPNDFRGEFTSAYGAAGTILKINLPTIVVEGSDKVEKVITVNDKTIIRRLRDDVTAVDLKAGDTVVVIGSPNDSAQIEARLIRVMPPRTFDAIGGMISPQAN